MEVRPLVERVVEVVRHVVCRKIAEPRRFATAGSIVIAELAPPMLVFVGGQEEAVVRRVANVRFSNVVTNVTRAISALLG